MRFADANIFLRFLAQPVTAADQARFAACSTLFARVKRGDETITTSEAVLAEVLFVLTSPRQYGLTAADAAARLEPIVAMRALHLPRKRLCQRALSILASSPQLGFEDALTAAQIQQSGMRLLSYDSDFDSIPGIVREEP
jgi:predicted nucleic acid-binding protein